ncbi:MAG: type II 3-dehydroquinate dehydratase [Bacteroidales bacterium]|jgi:3-dehydroquinate dehydratase-2|nr:type II 3-dehydroquinate dehydratase [Bacteroidales bacterium]MDD4703647.1 type II 3-dehydroquinate dehydratase [Bacteroidales bacterium]MDX9798823.1 type II 3-dehydroquinate dehydratase [Bacteroidales bacterium]
MRIIIINGPNLNLLGKREEEIYGSQSFEDYFQTLKELYPDIELEYYQSNIEGEIINKLHEVGFSFDGIVLNAGGYTHTSVSIADAVKSIKTPVIEVHISNILSRETYRHNSLIAPNCKGSIFGFGLKGYQLALSSFLF